MLLLLCSSAQAEVSATDAFVKSVRITGGCQTQRTVPPAAHPDLRYLEFAYTTQPRAAQALFRAGKPALARAQSIIARQVVAMPRGLDAAFPPADILNVQIVRAGPLAVGRALLFHADRKPLTVSAAAPACAGALVLTMDDQHIVTVQAFNVDPATLTCIADGRQVIPCSASWAPPSGALDISMQARDLRGHSTASSLKQPLAKTHDRSTPPINTPSLRRIRATPILMGLAVLCLLGYVTGVWRDPRDE